MNKRSQNYLLISLITLSLAVTAGFLRSSEINAETAALAEFHIEQLTCGSCISKVQAALKPLDGIGTVDVNLTRNLGRVTFDPSKTDSQRIAQTITSAGYPAKVRLVLSSEEYSALRNEEEQLGKKYVASVGGRLIARSDFDMLVRHQAGKAASSPSQQSIVWQKVWQELLQRELLLAAAEENNIIIQNGEVDVRLNELRQEHQGFEQIITERYGDIERFRDRLREDMIIRRNLEENVYAGINDPQMQQSKFQSWYASLEENTNVAVFDPRLKNLKQGGCGGGCCG